MNKGKKYRGFHPRSFIKKWTAALRSGEYNQGTGVLYQEVYNLDDEVVGNMYCCLGVAARLLGASTDTLVNQNFPWDAKCIRTNNAPSGLKNQSKFVETLAGLNDGYLIKETIDPAFKDYLSKDTYDEVLQSIELREQWSFARIADLIEELTTS